MFNLEEECLKIKEIRDKTLEKHNKLINNLEKLKKNEFESKNNLENLTKIHKIM